MNVATEKRDQDPMSFTICHLQGVQKWTGDGRGHLYCWVGKVVRVPADDQIFIEFHSDGHKTAVPIVQPAEKTAQTPM